MYMYWEICSFFLISEKRDFLAEVLTIVKTCAKWLNFEIGDKNIIEC